ncbi:integrase [Epilithonimonas hungarica]|uniref:site-specific integrase n=1 Tax=Epilithonimonas hungarica TaxID=454006 RepID=UPI0027872A4E|nr:site-specific integrase [Epilithonimonas hungarica]MDP9954675.1 integrase [Epilithonimonas hungarica]
MKNLNFGCRRSDFLVTNSNDDWFIQCRFYELGRKTPFTYRRRFNKFKNEKERKQVEKLLLKQMSELLDEKDYNPRIKQYMFNIGDLNPYLSVFESLNKALELKQYTPEYKKQVESAITRFNETSKQLSLDYIKIKDVELIHVKKILENFCCSNHSFNYTKKMLSSLFTELVDAGCLRVNPCTGIKSKIHIVERKDLFTDEELSEIEEIILKDQPQFYNFYKIFFYSGCRVPEMLSLRKKDVNIDRQEFIITLKKGGLYVQEKRAITADVLQFWKSQLSKVKDNDYIFSKKFQPGTTVLHRDYVYKFWKDKIGLKTIYTLKHTFLDKLEESNYNAQIAAGHRDDRTTSIYTVGRERRRLEAQKKMTLKK